MQLKIGPWDVTVEEVSSQEMQDLTNLGEWVEGLLKIKIRNDQHPGQKRDTVWHEIGHAISHVTGWIGDDKRTSEDAIRTLLPMQLSVLRDNPHLVQYLTGDYDGIEDFETRSSATETAGFSNGVSDSTRFGSRSNFTRFAPIQPYSSRVLPRSSGCADCRPSEPGPCCGQSVPQRRSDVCEHDGRTVCQFCLC